MRTSRRGDVDPFIVMDVMEAARAEEARGRSIVHMEVGQPGTPAPAAAREALARAMAAGPLGYTVALGIPALRARIARLYGELFRRGTAHSVEIWHEGRLAGGIYGVAIGRMFFGESMFSARSGGSKVALAALARWLDERGWPLIDAQVGNPHLESLGAEAWPRERFMDALAALTAAPGLGGSWAAEFGTIPASGLAGPTAG